MKRVCLFYTSSHVLRRYFCKKLQDTATSSFISCCFTSDFISADINFLKLFRTLFNLIKKKKKKIFVTNFTFLTDSPKLPLLYRPKSAKHDKGFLLIFPNSSGNQAPNPYTNKSLGSATIVPFWSNFAPLV